jgi:hypothetical protein
LCVLSLSPVRLLHTQHDLKHMSDERKEMARDKNLQRQLTMSADEMEEVGGWLMPCCDVMCMRIDALACRFSMLAWLAGERLFLSE